MPIYGIKVAMFNKTEVLATVYWEFNRLMDWGIKLLQNLVVLFFLLRAPTPRVLQGEQSILWLYGVSGNALSPFPMELPCYEPVS